MPFLSCDLLLCVGDGGGGALQPDREPLQNPDGLRPCIFTNDREKSSTLKHTHYIHCYFLPRGVATHATVDPGMVAVVKGKVLTSFARCIEEANSLKSSALLSSLSEFFGMYTTLHSSTEEKHKVRACFFHAANTARE